MAKRSLNLATLTPVGFADGAVDLVDNQYFGCIKGGTATMKIGHQEIYMGGQGAASAINIMILAFDATVGTVQAVGTAQADVALDAAATALATAALTGNTCTVKPRRALTGHILSLTFNAFGGIVRWVAAPGEEIQTYGQAVHSAGTTGGEVSLSAFTGSPGVLGGHWIYEPM